MFTCLILDPFSVVLTSQHELDCIGKPNLVRLNNLAVLQLLAGDIEIEWRCDDYIRINFL